MPDDRAPLARRLGVRRVYILNDDAPCSAGIAADFRRAAQRLGLRVAGSANWVAPRGLAERVRASGADGVFLVGYVLPFGARAITTLRRGLPAATRLIAPDGSFTPDVVRYAGHAAEGLTVSLPGPPLERLLGPGADFVASSSAAIGQQRPPTSSTPPKPPTSYSTRSNDQTAPEPPWCASSLPPASTTGS